MSKRIILMGLSLCGAIMTAVSQMGMINLDTEKAVDRKIRAKDNEQQGEGAE